MLAVFINRQSLLASKGSFAPLTPEIVCSLFGTRPTQQTRYHDTNYPKSAIRRKTRSSIYDKHKDAIPAGLKPINRSTFVVPSKVC